MPQSKKDRIIPLLSQGASYKDIRLIVGCSSATISYHAKRLGLSKGSGQIYDWDVIQKYYDSGHTMRDCVKKFGFCNASWSKAVQSGRIKSRSVIKVFKDLGSTPSRKTLKTCILREGILAEKCSACGNRGKWKGGRLVLQLDHTDGNTQNNKLSNLRLLCPNCHTQTPTFAGKNIGKHR